MVRIARSLLRNAAKPTSKLTTNLTSTTTNAAVTARQFSRTIPGLHPRNTTPKQNANGPFPSSSFQRMHRPKDEFDEDGKHEQGKDEKGRRYPPSPPGKEEQNLRTGREAPTFLGTRKRLPEFNLVDRVILVSGGGRGLGLVQAEALAEAGATVYVLDRLEQPVDQFFDVQRRAKEELGADIQYRQIDVTDEDGLRDTVEEIAEKHGRLDGLIAAAGINIERQALEYTAKDFAKILEVNVTGVFLTAQAVAREMIERGNGGSIALIASMSGSIANRGLICSAYNSSKAAVVQLARNLASEWGIHGIRVNTISPGYIVTPMTKHDFKGSKERETYLADGNMLGRLSGPEEYRGAGVFLLSNASSFMTGSDLIIDAGHHAW